MAISVGDFWHLTFDLVFWPYRLTVRTQDSQSCNRGSIPRRAAYKHNKQAMNKKIEKTNHIISLFIMILATTLLAVLFIKNSAHVPLVLHYINKFGDYLGTKNNLMSLIVGAWILYFFNLILLKTIKNLSENLFIFVSFSTMVVYFLFFILSLQLFLHNI